MARTAITAVHPTRAGVASPTAAAGDATNGNVVANTGRTIITVANADASNPHSVTFVIPGTVDGQAVADRVVSIPASASREFGGFPVEIYGGQMAIDCDSAQLMLSAREP